MTNECFYPSDPHCDCNHCDPSSVSVAPTIHVQDAPAYGDTFNEAVLAALAADSRAGVAYAVEVVS